MMLRPVARSIVCRVKSSSNCVRNLTTNRLNSVQNFACARAVNATVSISGHQFVPCHTLSSFSAPPEDPLGSALLDLVTYEAVCSDTLESLCEYFDQLVESSPHLKNADITFSDGVLTVQFGASHGTYVINRQSPNRQIWLSSPTSGPKRYDFVPSIEDSVGCRSNGCWVYRHDGRTLHKLLQDEIGPIVRCPVDFVGLTHGGGVSGAVLQ